MTGADFSTRIDVQQPSPVLLPVVGDVVSEQFTAGLSNYRSRLERSVSQTPSAAPARRTLRVQPAGGRQQHISSATASTTSSSSTRVAADSRRPVSQPALPTRRRRPTPPAATSTAGEPALRPEPVTDRPISPTSRTGTPGNDSPAPDETASSSTAGVATDETGFIQTTPADTLAQRTESAEAAPAEGTPPVDLQLFTIAEVTAQPSLAGSGSFENNGLPGSSSQSDEGPDTIPDPADLSGNDLLIPPVGIFVAPNLVDAATNHNTEAGVTTDETGQTKILQDDSQTDGPLVTVGDSQSGQTELTTDAQVSPQLSPTPNPIIIPFRQVQADASEQLLTAPGSVPGEVSSVTDLSDQTSGAIRADFRSVGPTAVAANDNSTTPLDDTSTATVGSADSSATAGLGEGVDSTTRRRGGGSSAVESQSSGTASANAVNQSSPTPPTGRANPAVAAVNSSLIIGIPTAADAEFAATGSQPIDVAGSTTDSRGASPIAPGTVTPSLKVVGSAQTANGPQGGQTTEMVDRVATALRTAHQSQRELRIRLTPPELGTVRIEISSRGGTLTARLEVETAAAQQAIQQNLSLLRDALAQHGTNLERIDIQLTPSRSEEGQPQSGGQHQPDSQQQERQEQQQPRQGSQESQRSEDEESPERSSPFRSLDELDIQV